MNEIVYNGTDMERAVTWSSYSIESLCEIESGRDIYDSERIPGDVPYCSATSVNNGIGYFVGNRNETLESECIQVNRNGSVGFAAYHPYPALYSNDCRKLRPFVKSRFVSLFFVNQIMMQKKKYGYGYKMGTARLKKQSIMLPSDTMGNPDYAYMANFMRERETELLERYLAYARMRIAECELFMKGDFTLNVKDRPWKVFKAFGEDGLFQIKATSSGVDAIKLKDGLDKTIPYISRSANNNGIVDFIDDSNREFGIDERGNITIGLDTQTAFYQPHEFVTGQNIHIVSGDKINRYTAQFLVVILRNQMNAKFNWGGNGATLGRLKRLKIMLPVNSSGQPDYEFMEQYVSERESTECWKSICGTYQSQDVPDLSEKEWGKYRFDEIFEIRPGKRLENRNKILGDIPFVGASDSNNGITGFVGNVNESLDSNTLGVSYNGAPCIAFHHPYECIFTDDVKHLHLKDHDDNEYVHLFLATVVGMQRVKYSYGYKFNEQRMKKQIIMLPMTDDGGPDYEYMENFVRSKESILLRRYCDYAEAKSSNSNSRYLRYKFTPSLPSNFLKSAGM